MFADFERSQVSPTINRIVDETIHVNIEADVKVGRECESSLIWLGLICLHSEDDGHGVT